MKSQIPFDSGSSMCAQVYTYTSEQDLVLRNLSRLIDRLNII